MAFSALVEQEENGVQVLLQGDFDFDCHDEFKKLVEKIKALQSDRFFVDMGAVNRIDSSALGMMLLLKDAVPSDATIQLKRCQPEVLAVFRMANFERYFSIV